MIEKRFNLGMKGSLIKSLLQRLLPGGEIDASLSNKVNLITWFDRDSIKDILSCPSGNYQVAPTVADMPLTGRYWHVRAVLTAEGGECTLRAEDVVAGVIYTQTYSISAWHGWIGPYATAEPPQEYDLPLAAGVTGTAKYCIDQIGYVHIRGWVGGVDAIAASTPLIATLPAGYRPEISREAILPVSSADSSFIAYRLKIFDTGEMRVLSATDRSRVTKGISIDIDLRAS